jgi:hypothetical protein
VPDLNAEYASVEEQAALAEAGGLAKERAVLLLWFLRAMFGIDDLDAYEFVCDDDDDGGIDGLYLEEGSGEQDQDTLVIFQSKYPERPNPVGRTSLEGLIANADKLQTAEGLRAFLVGRVNDQVRSLIARFRLLERLEAGDAENGMLKFRLVFVTAGVLNDEAKGLVTATTASRGGDYLTTYDLLILGPVARSAATPSVPQRVVSLPIDESSRLVIGYEPHRILIGPGRALDVVQWEGVTDRTLFELNVRRELRSNPVRKQLDAAILRTDDHKDFLAYHNGLTITCSGFELLPNEVRITAPSIVNGAQSVIAFHAALAPGHLSDDLRVFVKVVETSGRPGLAEQVSRRSNTQNPVNARNLVANTPRQRRLAAEFDESYPHFYYETKPDTAAAPAAIGRTIIQNDDVAQLLCAVMLQEPWLAVKRTVLFDPENHPRVFSETITAAHVLLVHQMAASIEAKKTLLPGDYRRSWRLTKLVGVYLSSQLLRASDPGTDERRTIDDPQWAVADLDRLDATLGRVARHVAAALKVRRDIRQRDSLPDDFKVDFKRQDALHQLRDDARNNYLYQLTLEG